ncbi:MAG: phytanoyl-CoA dioxygenase family protein [Sulfitobacter sp.]|uniref:phytanoyl-CoA dioxygenase family protein n=1 Tax=Roseibium sp. TaxID=1936156 RepID=UPI003264E207
MKFRDDSAFLNDINALKAHAVREGYLFLKGILDRGLLLSARDAIADCLTEYGYCTNGSNSTGLPVHQYPEQDFYGSGIDAEAYKALQRLEELHAVAHSQGLHYLMRSILGVTPLLHPNFILRTIFPNAFAIPAHQDLLHTRGSVNTWTCWIPLTDCPRQLGGLTLLPRTHSKALPTRPQHNGGRETILDNISAKDWIGGDFNLGDVLVFHGLTVHRALPNRSEDQLRISMDCRFQPPNEAIRQITLEPHGQLQTWDDIYAGWKRRDNCWYWRKFNLVPIQEPSAN